MGGQGQQTLNCKVPIKAFNYLTAKIHVIDACQINQLFNTYLHAITS